MNQAVTLFSGLRPANLFVLLFVSFLGLATQNLNAQNVTVNPGAGSYPTLTDAFAAINAGTHTGALTVDIVGNTTETATAVLNASGTGAASYISVVISPSGGATRTISGNIATNLIDLNGADNVTINGLNTGGNALTISNTATGGANTIRLIGDASNNTIANTRLEGSASTLLFAVVNFGTGTTTGNDGNTLSNCDITAAGANLPISGIFSLGAANIDNSGNTVTGCRIFDFFSATATSIGIHINATNALSSSAWTITNNRLYQTATRVYTTSNTHQGIFVGVGSGYTITGNTIGFANAGGTGSYNMIGNSVDLAGFPGSYTPTGTANATRFIAIGAAFTAAGTNSVIQNNTVAGIALYTSSGATTTNGIVCGVNVTTGNATISNNTIGATSGTGSIYTACTTSGGVVVGIFATSANTLTIQNNTVGAIDAMGSTASISGGITGINSAGTAVVNISNNTVGNTTNPNLRMGNLFNGTNLSNNGTFSIATGFGDFKGIINQSSGAVTISNNIVRNASLNSSATAADFRGIEMTSGNYTVSGNTITAHTTASTNTTVATGLLAGAGILGQGGTAGSVVTQNTINDLSLTNTTSTGTNVAGISISSTAIDVTRNRIWDLRNASTSVTLTTPGSASGVFIRSATAAANLNIVNNMITLGTGQATNTSFFGIWSNHGSSPNPNVNVYHNSIRIEGAAASGANPSFGFHRGNFAAAVVNQIVVDIKNNIFDNTRTGGTGPHCAIGNYFNATTTSGVNWGTNASNFNVLNSADPATVGFWQTAQTIAGWRTASVGDPNSISGAVVNYVNVPTGDLHILFPPATVVEGAGTPVAAVTVDFDGQTRANFSPVDLGADAGNFLDYPIIFYTPIGNQCFGSPAVTLTASITDVDGVPTSGTGLPVLYWRINSGAYTPATGTFAGGGNYTFSFGAAAPNFSTISYYIVAQDNLGNVGASPALGASGFTINPPAASTPPSSPSTYQVGLIGGTYTVGVGGNFTTLTAAASAYNNSCMSGPVLFSLTDAMYPSETFPITINSNPNASATNTLTIKPAVATTISGSTNSTMIQINGGDFITIDGSIGNTQNSICPRVTATRNLTITNTNTTAFTAVVWLNAITTAPTNGVTNCTVKNCIIVGGSNVNTAAGIGIGALPLISGGIDNDFNRIENNEIRLCRFGIYVSGQNATNKDEGNVINLNLLTAASPNNIGEGGIFNAFQNNVTVSANEVDNIIRTASPDSYGINLGFGVSNGFTSTTLGIVDAIGNATVTLNKVGAVTNSGTFAAVGIAMSNTLTGSTQLIANNTISGVVANGTSTDMAAGIWLNGGTGTTNVLHNTVVMQGIQSGASSGNATSTAFGVIAASSALTIRNNIFVNTQGGGVAGTTTRYAAIALGYASPYTGLLSNFNDLFSAGAGPGTYVVGITGGVTAGTSRITLADWQTETSQDASTKNVSPVFTSATDLRLVAADPANGTLICGGTQTSVNVDIECQNRKVTATIGADEVPSGPTASISVAETSGTVANDGNICTNASATLTASGGVTYLWSTSATTAVITVAPSATTTYTVTVTDASGCATATATTITVNPLPTPGITAAETSGTAPNDGIICNGASAILTATGGGTYLWSTNAVTSSITVSPTTNTTYTVTVTSAAGCTASATFAVTVNPLPAAAISAAETSGTTNNDGIICTGASATLTATGGTSYLWNFNNSTTAAISVNPIATTTYTVTVTNANNCSVTATFTVVVNALPTPSIAPANPVTCSGSPITLTASGGTAYAWSTNQSTAAISVSPIAATMYTVTVTNINGCSASTSATVNVNATPVLTSTKVEPTNCISTDGSIDLTVTGAGTFTYNWNGIGIQQGQQDQSNLAVGSYFVTVTNSGTGCTSTLSVPLIGPGGCDVCPTISSLAAPTGVCNGSAVTLTANGLADMGVTYGILFKYSTSALANPYTGGTTIATIPNGGLGAGGTTATTNFTFPTTGNYFVYAILSPVPNDPTCRPSRSATVGVNPVPNVNAVTNKVHCVGNAVLATAFSSSTAGATFSWTRTSEAIGLAATSGTGNVPAFTAANATNAPLTSTFTVVATFTANGATCTGTPITFTITVNPTPTVADPADQVVCNATSTTAVAFTGTVLGTVYNWTNNTTSIGLAASGTGDIAAFTATNAGNTPVTATITVTPSYTNAGVTCSGASQTFTIIANPTPTANAVASQVRCNGTATAAVTFGGAVTGTVYNWTNNQPSIGLAASGTGNIASFTATNASGAPVVATITVTPSYTNGGVTCMGASQTFTITVNPTPTVSAVANQTFCSGLTAGPLNFTSNATGTTYVWSNSNTAIGLAAGGTGNIPAFTATNATGAAITATIIVTPTFTGSSVACTGAAITFTITVSPTPTVAAVANQLLCSESTTTAVTFTGSPVGTVFNWTNNTPAIGLAASGTGDIAAFVAQNPGSTTLVATITVTPAFTSGGTTCFGTARTFTITVNPLPKVNVGADLVICQDQTATLNAVLSGGAFFGTWSGGVGIYGNKTAASTTYLPAASEYGQTITLTFTTNDPAGPCPSASDALTLTVNTLPIVNAGADILICEGDKLTLSLLNATITANGSGVSTGVWSSTGTGTFQPNANFPTALTYTPSAADIVTGYVILRLTSDDPAGPCGAVIDEVRLGFHEELAMSCDDLLHVSLDVDCISEVNPDDVLEGDADDYKFYTVRLFNNLNQPLPGGNVVGTADVGKTYKVKVTDICTGNFCWGNVKVEDKLAPTLTCADVTLTCVITNFTPGYITGTLGIAAGTPTVFDCSTTTLTYDDVWTDLTCTGSINGKSNVSAFIKRDWLVKDAWNNFSVCTQYIYLERRGIAAVKFPTDVDLVCTNANTDPSSTGTPFLTDFGKNWPLFPDQASCELSVGKTDQILPVCGNSYKILRTWTVYDWCLPTNPGPTGTLNPRFFIQVIKVTDNVGPTIACPTNLTVSTNPFNCCANADLPDVIISDNCGAVASITATVEGADPLTNVPFSYAVVGNLTTFAGNNLWNPDTLGVVGATPCLPLGTYPVKYVAEDLCGNQRTCSFNITVADLVAPAVACDKFTQVSLGVNGKIQVNALTFDDGTADVCCLDRFEAARMNKDCNGLDDDFGPQVEFCCTDINDTITVVFRAYDCSGNTNDCMVQVFVDDKLKPTCVSPATVTVSCENFDPSLWAYGFATGEDNCCIDTITTTTNFSQFDTLCSRGTITRTFRVFDCAANSTQCTQRVFVNYEQDYFVKFPDDRIVSVCDGTGNFGEPTFLNKDCELLGVSFTDEVFTVVPDACFKIERTWHIINWCRYNANLPLTDVPNPNPNATVNSPANNAGPVVSSSSNPAVVAAPWTATRVAIVPGATQTDYSVFYNGGTYTFNNQVVTVPSISNSNGFSYKQIIKVLDTQDPTIENCPASPVTFCDLTPNDGNLWNEIYWYDNGTMQHDLCEGPTDLTITATDACSGSNINIKYLLFLDTDNNGSMETVISSTNLPGFNNVQFNNAQNLNFTGGTPSAFDERPVPSNQKYGFALQTTTSGTKKTGAVRWNTFQSQGTYVVPELPYGTHKIKWIMEDGCGNESICEYTFIVKDCKAPTVVCRNGLSVNIMPTGMIQLWASDFLQYTEDNCTPSNKLQIAIRKVGAADGQGNTTGFPRNADGTPQTNVAFTCAELGQQEVELWSIDLAGNADFCLTYVIVQDNNGNCEPGGAVVAGYLKTEEQQGLEDANVEINGSMAGIPSFIKSVMTDQNGYYEALKSVPLGANFTVTPTHDANPLNGVSTYDLVLISKHILGLEPLTTPYKMIAADANKSGSITTFDIVEIRKLILGIYTELPNNTSWRFTDKYFAFPDPLNPFKTAFPENKSVADIQAHMLSGDFVAMKIGDVNGSATAHSLMNSEDRTAGTLLFDVSRLTSSPSPSGAGSVTAGEVFEVTFKAATAAQGYQFTLNLNGLTVTDIVEAGKVTAANFGLHEGALTVSVNGESQFTVRFQATKSGQLSDMLGVSSRITKAEAYTLQNERQEVALRFGKTTVGVGFELYQNQPNPFVSKTAIGFHLPEAATATLTVYDETGRTLFTQKGDYAKGYNSVAVERALLDATGVLYYKLETATDSATKQMIQVK